MAHAEDMSITFIAKPNGTYDLIVATNEGYNPRVEVEIGPEEMIAVASLIDQFQGMSGKARSVKTLLRETFRAQVQRAERDLETAKRVAKTIPDHERKLNELRKAVVA